MCHFHGRLGLFFSGAKPLVAHVCGDPLSRYTCRATRVAVVLELPGVSHVKLPLKRCRATRGVAATLAGVALHCATTAKPPCP